MESSNPRSEYQREYYRKHRERILARHRERAKTPEHRQRKREAAAKWRKENPERERLKAREGRARREYGLTVEEYDAILARGCGICGSHTGRVVGKRNGQEPPPPRLCIDHDHANGKIRDALCHGCNTGLGSFGDDPARLRVAADYLEKHLED
jgi:hypothetical protein